ncbi:hypothetical protein [Psychroserpens damuponensis]|uniref:hypothetical protein n=1 Tax=Psychroserpens damuponensis TaxID=943936 RepID=UPI00058DE868|nr:hypothetical protein [Psychroserpens damuponensis]
MILVKIILIITLGLIFIQDYKERRVFWFLFPIVGLCSGFLFYNDTLPELFITSIILNLAFVTLLLLVIILYSKLVLKVNISEAFGLGDALLFIGLIFSFSTISFLIIFVFALVFSLIAHLSLKRFSKIKSVPLAGYLSLFFGASYISFWLGITNSLYAF